MESSTKSIHSLESGMYIYNSNNTNNNSNSSSGRKRELSPSPPVSATAPSIKRTRIDNLFDSKEEDDVDSLGIGEEDEETNNNSNLISFWESQSPARYHKTGLEANEDNPENEDDDDEEEDEEGETGGNSRFSLGDRPFRRSLYSELLLSSNLAQDDVEELLPRRKSNAFLGSSLFEMDEEEDDDEKTTLPMSRPYRNNNNYSATATTTGSLPPQQPQPVYEDEVDAFFSSHNPADEPEYVLDSTLKMSILLQHQNDIPPYFTEGPHFLTNDYFDHYGQSDRFIPTTQQPTINNITKEMDGDKSTASIFFTPLFDSKFSILGEMGSGEYATVYKVQDLNTHEISAIKKSKIPFGGWDDRWQQLIEVEHIKRVAESKYCVNMLNAWEEKGLLYIQLELCSNGSLDKFIRFKNGKISQDIVWKIFYEIVLGIQDIHQAEIVHLDLKPSNILIDDKGRIKIGDFGISVHTPVDARLVKGEGDRRYMAPDLLREDFNKPADIFSLGLVLLELATGIILPGTGESWEMLRIGDFSKQKVALSKLSSEMSDMIEWLLMTEAKERPTVHDIIQHPTFINIQNNMEETEPALLNYVMEMEKIQIIQADERSRHHHSNSADIYSTPEGGRITLNT